MVRTGDPAFDRRFKLHDRSGVTARLFDEGLRARAAAVLDGWVALWAPFDYLLFGRLPALRDRSRYRKLGEAEVRFQYRQ